MNRFAYLRFFAVVVMAVALNPVQLSAQTPSGTAGSGTAPGGVNAINPALTVLAAGSLREALMALEKGYADENPTRAASIQFLFGPSGKLRERIEAGEKAHLFASASLTHTEKLVDAGKLRSSTVFAGNSLCLLARSGVALTESGFVELLLSDTTKLGTSTPVADPAGDYTWEMFRKIGATRPGALEALDRKALKLTGAEIGAQSDASPYARALTDRRADVFVTYCTNAKSARRQEPTLNVMTVPAAFDVMTSYAIGITPDAPDAARDFLRYVLSQRAQKIMVDLGFSPPALKCDRVEGKLQPAYAAWMAGEQSVASAPGTSGVPVVNVAQRLALVLHPGDKLTFAAPPLRAQGKRPAVFGGAVAFTASATGHLEVFLDRRAWIDVVRLRDQTALQSLRADRWLGCAGVGKNLGFNVEQGERYELRLSEIDGARASALLMMIAGAP